MTISNGIYRLRNAKSGTYLDASMREPGKLHGWESHPDQNNQQWRVEQLGDRYTFQNVHSQQFLSSQGAYDGSNVHASRQAAFWNLRQDGRSYVIVAENSNSTVDLDWGSSDNGASINLWGDSGAEQQRWIFEQISGGPHQYTPHEYGGTSQSGVHPPGRYNGPLSPGNYFIRNVHTGTALDLSGSGTQDGTRVIGYQAGLGENQKWILEPGNHGYVIRNAASGTYLGFGQHEQPADGLLITGNSRSVEWHVTQADQGYQIFLAESNWVLDLASGDPADGAKICLWSNNGANNQKWNLHRA